MKLKQQQKGFSITELIVMLVLIGIIAGVAIPEMLNALDRARQKKSIAVLHEWGAALGAYYVDYNFYPFDPTGPDAPVIPGTFLYDMMKADKYMVEPKYLDGWNHVLKYTGGINMISSWGYTIASLGKGNVSELNMPSAFRCFQCDIRLRNGVFFSRPVGTQTDNLLGCLNAVPCI